MNLFPGTCLIVFCFVFGTFGQQYDFIIVGGGGPGATLAYRLSENPTVKVALIERGSDLCHIFGNIVGFYGAASTAPPSVIPDIFSRTIYDRHWFSREITTNSRYIPVSTMMGGGAARNGNAFGRMSIAEMEGFNSPLWTFNATTQDWKALFTYVKCLTSPCDLNAHGTTGPLMENTFAPDSVLEIVKNAYMSAFNLSWDDDSNDGTNIGLSLMHRNIKLNNFGIPIRQESYCSLLKPVIDVRPNLHVITEAVVTRIDLKKNGKNRVEFFHRGKDYSYQAKNEVIIATSPIEAPQLLKLSGVGPCSELATFGIECLYDNPHVGETLQDNPTVGLIYVTPPPITPSLGSIVVGYIKSDPNQQLADIEVAATTLAVPTQVGILNGVLAYVSDFEHGGLGRVLLKSADPLKEPTVSVNVYTYNASRISRLREKVKQIREAFQAVNVQLGVPFFTQADPRADELPLNASDAAIDAYLNSEAGSSLSWHWTGSTAMHKVVDERLRLIDGLGNIIPGVRVVGNGVVPNCLKSHSTSSFSMMVGQTASRLIKEEYGY